MLGHTRLVSDTASRNEIRQSVEILSTVDTRGYGRRGLDECGLVDCHIRSGNFLLGLCDRSAQANGIQAIIAVNCQGVLDCFLHGDDGVKVLLPNVQLQANESIPVRGGENVLSGCLSGISLANGQ